MSKTVTIRLDEWSNPMAVFQMVTMRFMVRRRYHVLSRIRYFVLSGIFCDRERSDNAPSFERDATDVSDVLNYFGFH